MGEGRHGSGTLLMAATLVIARPCTAAVALARRYQPDLHINCGTISSPFYSPPSPFFLLLLRNISILELSV